MGRPGLGNQSPSADGRELFAIRQRLGLDQTAFGALLAVPRQEMISRYERGERRVPPAVLMLARLRLAEHTRTAQQA